MKSFLRVIQGQKNIEKDPLNKLFTCKFGILISPPNYVRFFFIEIKEVKGIQNGIYSKKPDENDRSL